MRITLLFILIILSILGVAQTVPKQLRFNHLFIQDGLPDGHILSMKQDKEGYIWLGTSNRLIRYDGYATKKYRLMESVSDILVVGAICEDAEGRLWFGVDNKGIFYYDRKADSTIFFEDKNNGFNVLGKARLESIADDKEGNLWIIITDRANNENSLVYFNTSTEKFLHYSVHQKGKLHLNSAHLTNLIKTRKGSICVGSDSGILLYDYRSQKFVNYYAVGDTSKQLTIKYLCEDPVTNGLIWAVSNRTNTQNSQGLIKFQVDQRNISLITNSLQVKVNNEASFVYNIIGDSKQRLWILCDKGFCLYDRTQSKFKLFPFKFNILYPEAYVKNKVVEDKTGRLWFILNSKESTSDIGIVSFDPKIKTYAQYVNNPLLKDGFVSDHVVELFQDNERNIWFQAAATGVQWINKKASNFGTLTEAFKSKYDIKENTTFLTAAEAADHTFWISNTNGLYHWFPLKDSMALLKVKQQLFNKPLGPVTIDNDNNIWFGGVGERNYEGLFCYNPVTRKLNNYTYSEKDSTSISNNFISVIYKDHSGDIWIGTWGGGLCKYDKSRHSFTRYPFVEYAKADSFPASLCGSNIFTIFEDKNYTLWVGTLFGGINKLNTASKTFTSPGTKASIRTATSICENDSDNLWIGTYVQGLAIFNKKTFTSKWVTEREGLLHNGVQNILKDDDGNAWIITLRGISILNKKGEVIRNLTSELLQGKRHGLNFSLKTANGSFFIFMGNNGPVIINPADFKPDSITPLVHIESIIYNKPHSKNKSFDSAIVCYGRDKIELMYDENRVTFNYVGLIYQNVSQVLYKFKLDGYDNDWLNATTQRTVTYTNLAPGNYTFHVTAANSDGVWSIKDDSIIIVIAPPFWQAWWFRTLLAFAIAGLISLFVKIYLNRKLQAQQMEFDKLKAIEKVRAKISMDIHDEISSGLTKISLLSQRVENKFERNKEIEPEVIKKINSSSKEVISNLGEIIWAVNPKHDNLQSLLAYIRNYATNFFESTSIQLNIHFPDEVISINVSPDIKHNLFLVIKEALNNVVKHANANDVKLKFNCSNERYQFIIKDNGRGIYDMNGRAFGNGLTNMKKRMAAINGTLAIESEEQKGTVVIIEGKFM